MSSRLLVHILILEIMLLSLTIVCDVTL